MSETLAPKKPIIAFLIIVLCLFLCIVFLAEAFLLCREEGSLVEQFVFEALVTYMESLALAHADEKSLGRWRSSVLSTH